MKVFRLAFAGLLFGSVVSAQAALRIFCGMDAVQFPSDPRPNSNAAFAQFVVVAASNNSMSVANFDELPDAQKVGSIGSNASIASALNLDANSGVNSADDVILGFNTSPSAGKHYRLSAIDTSATMGIRFDFATAINSFGAFFTGVGTSGGTAYLKWTNSRGTQTLNLQELSGGSVQFCGFTDIGETFTSVSLIVDPENGFVQDVIGVDDVAYSNCNPVPEPSTMAVIGLGGLALLRKRRK